MIKTLLYLHNKKGNHFVGIYFVKTLVLSSQQLIIYKRQGFFVDPFTLCDNIDILNKNLIKNDKYTIS